MKLDRNNNPDGKGKYALVKLRNFPAEQWAQNEVAFALKTLAAHGMLDYGDLGTESEFMVMRLKDKYAYKGLMGYFRAVSDDDEPDLEYAQEILDMANRSGPHSQWCKKPD
jgi:hypothetical protein